MSGTISNEPAGRPLFEQLERRILLDGAISGQLWNDLNGDGIHDGSEPGLNGWAIELVDPSGGTVLDTQITATGTEAGQYSFGVVPADSYEVRRVSQAGWQQTYPAGGVYPLEVIADPITDVDFGEVELGTISGVKFEDLNGDGVKDAGEPGLEGRTIYLDLDEDGQLDGGNEPYVVTNAAGEYAFTDLPPGIYMVSEVAQPGWIQTYPSMGEQPSPEVEIIIDNDDPGFTFFGGWVFVSSRPGYYGTFYAHDGNMAKGVWSATFTPSIPIAGEYEVYMWWPDWATAANNVPVDIYHGEGTATVTVDESTNGGQWNFVGSYSFEEGTSGNVVIRTDGTISYVVADAVRFFKAGTGGEQVVEDVVDNEDARCTLVGDWNVTSYRPNHYGADYLHDLNDLKGQKSVTFTPTLPTTGEYEVYMWWPVWAGAANNVPVDVMHDGATTTVIVDESINGGQWYSIGMYQFTAHTGSVTIRTDGTTSHVLADAVRFMGNFEGPPGPPEPPEPPEPIIIDDQDPGADPQPPGDWYYDDWFPGAYNTWYADNYGDEVGQTFTFTPTIPLAGEYDVYMWWPNDDDEFMYEDVPVDIIYSGGTDTLSVDQTINGGQWNLLGSYDFDGGIDGKVVIRTDGTDGYDVVADAVKFVFTGIILGPFHWIELDYGEVVEDVDFGNIQLSDIRGTKWNDLNGDGVKDAGEPGLEGWTIYLDENQNGHLDPGETSTMTAPDGSYAFVDRMPGDYDVREILQPMWIQTSPPGGVHALSLISGQDLTGIDFGNQLMPAEIHGRKWHDLDGDSIWDAGEPVLEGWTIYLDLDEDGQFDNGVEPYDVTNAAGQYSFIDLVPGTYSVREVLQPGWQRSSPSGTGELSFVEVVRDGVDGVDGLFGASSVTVSPDGSHVYAAGQDDAALVVFSRDVATGELSFVEVIRDGVDGVDGLAGAASVTVSPDGAHVYAAGSWEEALAVFSRDAATGQLSFVEVLRDGVGGVDGLDVVTSVTVSPDGNHVYAAGSWEEALAVFSRNAATGELSFVEVVRDGVDGVDGLSGVGSVTVSPDGSHVYAAGSWEEALAVFSRNAATGELSFVEVIRDGVGGVDGLSGVTSVTVSPDGSHVYAAGLDDNALAVFNRDAGTGELSFVEVIRDEVGGVDGLFGAVSVTVSPDGHHVYAAGYFDYALAVFSRDVATGQLSFVEVLRDGVDSVDGLLGVRSVIVSPDGNHVYAAGIGDNALAVFNRDTDPVHHIALDPDEIVYDLDFGNYEFATISGQKFEDLNGDGQLDAGEPGLEGWTIYLDLDEDGEFDEGVEPFDVTNAAGEYVLSGLAPGTYVVGEVLQEGWRQTFPAWTEVIPGPEFQVNTYWQGTQYIPSLAMSDTGQFVVAWMSYGRDGDSWGIFAQRYNSAGTPLGNEFQVNTYWQGDQRIPSVGMSDSGQFVIAWSSEGQDGESYGIFAQRYNSDGTPAGDEFQVNTYWQDWQYDPCVAMDDSGGFVIAWRSWGQDGESDGIFAQRYNSDGTPAGAEFQVNTYWQYWQDSPSVAMDDSGQFIIAWTSEGQDGEYDGIFAQRYSSAGTPQGDEFQVNTYWQDDQQLPSVAMSDTGDFVIAWRSEGQDGEYGGVFAQRYNSAGTPLGNEFQVNTYWQDWQDEPCVAMDDSGQFIIAWMSEGQDGESMGIFAQRYSSAGTPLGDEFQVNTYWQHDQMWPSVAMDDSGQFVIAWMSYEQDWEDAGIFAKQFSGGPGFHTVVLASGQVVEDIDFGNQEEDNFDLANFQRLAPLGGLILSGGGGSALYGALDTDTFRFAALAGETITAVLTPDDPMAIVTIELAGLAGPYTASGGGEAVVLPAALIPADGEYTILVSGDAATAYTLNIYHNAVLEAQVGDSADGSELSIDDSFVDLGSGRYAVVGSSGALPDTDEYTLSLTAGQIIDVILAGQDDVDFSTELLELLDVDGTAVLAAAVNDPMGVAATNYDLAILDFDVPADGVYTLRLTSQVQGEYGIVVTEGLVFDSEPNDALGDPLRSLDEVREALGYLDVELEYQRPISDVRVHVLDTGFFLPLEEGPFTARLSQTQYDQAKAMGYLQDHVNFDPPPYQPDENPDIYWLCFEDIPDGGDFDYEDVQILVQQLGPNAFGLLVFKGTGGFDHRLVLMPEHDVLMPLIIQLPDWVFVQFEDPTVDGSDNYTIQLNEGEVVTIVTSTPGEGVFGFGNTLDPAIGIYDPSDTLVADDQDSAPDGRNAELTYIADQTGVYTVLIGAASGWGEYTVVVDILPRSAIPTGVDLLASSDSGISATDDLTNLDNSEPAKTLQFEVGGTVVGATVTVYADGVTIGSAMAIAGTTTVITDGTYDLADGSYSITARQIVPGEVQSYDSPALSVTIDTAAPVLTVDLLTTMDWMPELTGTVDDPAVAVQVTVDGNPYAAVNNGDGTWTLADDTISPLLAVGTYDVAVEATDQAGNSASDATTDELEIVVVEAIVDNASAAVTGDWLGGTYRPNYHDANYLHDRNTNKGNKSVTFTPALPEDGRYEVYLWWPDADIWATNVLVDVSHNGVTTTVSVDQSTNGGQWNLLGTYDFTAGTGGVTIRTDGTTSHVAADAARFLRIGDITAGEVIVDNASAAVDGDWLGGTYRPNFHDADYLHDRNADKGNKSVTFTPSLTQDGQYEVYLWWPDADIWATNVPVDIEHDGDTSTVLVDESTNGGQWNLIGTYNFTAGTGSVIIRTVGTTSHVAADAVRFLRIGEISVGDVIVDNSSAAVSGDWQDATYRPNYHDADYLHDKNADKGNKSVTFTPSLTQDGRYEVYMWWPDASIWATNVPVDIEHDGDTSTVSVDESINGGQWNLVGTYNFTAGTGSVIIRTVGTTSHVAADAVRFLRIGEISVGDVIVDNSSAAVDGDWQDATYRPNYHGADYLHDKNAGKGSNSVTFTPTLPQDGQYEVYMWWPDAPIWATNVPVDIEHDGDTSTVIVDQSTNGGLWFLVGTYDFTAGTGSVMIRTDGTTSHVAADAVRFVRVGDIGTLTVTVDPLTTTDTTPELTGTVSDPAAAVQVTVDGNTYSATNNGDGTWTLADDAISPALALGTYDVMVEADIGGAPVSDGTVNELEIVAPVVEVIVDNTSATVTGDWMTTSYRPNYYGANYLHDKNSDKGNKSITFTPTLPQDGQYEVYVWWPDADVWDSNVPVDIAHNGGTSTVSVDQSTNGGQWNLIGTYDFTAGTTGSVTIRTNGTTLHVAVDAVRFLRVGDI